MRHLLALLAFALLFDAHARASEAEVLRIAVAANFRATAEAIGAEFAAGRNLRLTISSASTGVLAAQLRAGAPFDLLLAADRERPEALAQDGFTAGLPRCYARGSLVLLGADTLEAPLGDASLSIAIANPATAPYGAAALAVLQREGFAGPQSRRVVRGGNVLQALQYFESGAADMALVASSLRPGTGIAVPDDWHPPIDQYAVISASSDNNILAEAFLAYLSQEPAQAAMTSRGYQPCP